MQNGYKEFGTLGLSRTGVNLLTFLLIPFLKLKLVKLENLFFQGMCHAIYSCVTVELGVWSALGDNYPTTGIVLISTSTTLGSIILPQIYLGVFLYCSSELFIKK